MSPVVLIVEDDTFLARLLTAKLSQEPGITLELARDGEEALRLIRTHQPSLIVLDLMIPKKSGFEVLRELRQDQKTASLPVLIISNLGSQEDIQQARELGVVDYFVKTTVTVSELIEKIRGELEKRLGPPHSTDSE